MKERVLGVSIGEKAVQAVELERDGSSMTLLAIDEWANNFPANRAMDGSPELERFMEYLSAFIKVNHVKARQTSVALDTAFLFLQIIPTEPGLSRTDINDQINWELGQYFPNTPAREYITDIHAMPQVQTQSWTEILSVSVKRREADAIQKALTQTGLELNILDADHFSADMALRVNYPDTYRRSLALVGVKENRLDFSLMKNGTLERYSYCLVNSNQEIVEQIARVSSEFQGILSITAYGPYLDKDLLVQIRRESPLLVEALNPLRHVDVSDTLRLADHLVAPSYRFASAVGVSLRRD